MHRQIHVLPLTGMLPWHLLQKVPDCENLNQLTKGEKFSQYTWLKVKLNNILCKGKVKDESFDKPRYGTAMVEKKTAMLSRHYSCCTMHMQE